MTLSLRYGDGTRNVTCPACGQTVVSHGSVIDLHEALQDCPGAGQRVEVAPSTPSSSDAS